MSDEEKKEYEELKSLLYTGTISQYGKRKLIDMFEKQSKEIEELKETLKCTQNSWFEDTQKIEEMKKQIDLDNECEIALNSKVMDLEKEIEELKEKNKKLQDKAKELIFEKQELTSALLDSIPNDKIKAKIEEVDYKMIAHQDVREAVKQVLNSLLEKE